MKIEIEIEINKRGGKKKKKVDDDGGGIPWVEVSQSNVPLFLRPVSTIVNSFVFFRFLITCYSLRCVHVFNLLFINYPHGENVGILRILMIGDWYFC